MKQIKLESYTNKFELTNPHLIGHVSLRWLEVKGIVTKMVEKTQTQLNYKICLTSTPGPTDQHHTSHFAFQIQCILIQGKWAAHMKSEKYFLKIPRLIGSMHMYFIANNRHYLFQTTAHTFFTWKVFMEMNCNEGNFA